MIAEERKRRAAVAGQAHSSRYPDGGWRIQRNMSTPRMEKLKEMLAGNPADSFLLYALATEYNNAGEHEEAISTYRKLIEGNADYVAAYFHLGQTLEKTGEEAEARSTYETGCETARRIGDAHALSEMQEALNLLG